MKCIIIPIYLVLSLLLWSKADAQNSKKEEKAQKKLEAYQSVVDLIESGKYEFQARKANPQRGRQIDLTTNPNYLRVDQDHLVADLPYFGVIQVGSLSGEGGVKFDGKPLSYDVNRNDDKHKITINFKIQEKGESYNCTLNVSSESNAALSISFVKRDRISYYGELMELETK